MQLCYFLDDIPRMVEIYTGYRAQGRAKDFSKRLGVLEAVRRCAEVHGDWHFSVRAYETFAQVLVNMTAFHRRISPWLEEAVTACACCFGKPFAGLVRRYLLGYFDQITVERLGPLQTTGQQIYAIRTESESAEHFVARGCNPARRGYQMINVVGMLAAKGSRRGAGSYALWPPYRWFLKRMRRKAHALADPPEPRVNSAEFRGSIEAGIDVRESLRSHLGIVPRIFVKHRLPPKARKTDEHEPIVWLLDLEQISESIDEFCLVWFGLKGGTPYVSTCYFYTREVYEEPQIRHRKLAGLVSFCDSGTPFAEISGRYGDEIERRIPKLDALSLGSAKNSWWERLFLAALQYAKKTVLYVSPEGFSIPERIVRRAARIGKAFCRIPLSIFSPLEQRKIRYLYACLPPCSYAAGEDHNCDQAQSSLVKQYEGTMEQYWD